MSRLDLSRTDMRLLTSIDLESIKLENVEALKNKISQLKTGYIVLGVVFGAYIILRIYEETKQRKQAVYSYNF